MAFQTGSFLGRAGQSWRVGWWVGGQADRQASRQAGRQEDTRAEEPLRLLGLHNHQTVRAVPDVHIDLQLTPPVADCQVERSWAFLAEALGGCLG